MLLTTLLSVYFVAFADKAGTDRIALSPTALEMREAHHIALDSLDYAVSPAYLDSLRSTGADVLHTSRWMNGATVKADSAVAKRIEAYSFVQYIEKTRDDEQTYPQYISRRKQQRDTTSAIDYGYARKQLETYNLPPLHNLGYHGQGIRMAVIDGGFENANTLQAFDSVRTRILGHYDLTDDPYDFFGNTGSHGTMCLSAIAAIRENYHGAATGAQYYIMRTEEYDTESPKELDNWVAAIELADSLGVHISSTSLGYTEFDNPDYNFTYQDMDGRSNRASRAATIAARKGMLVIVAAGNEGSKPWYYISAPADADSILTVGAVNIDGYIAPFSSYGPTADGRIKPEVCAVGWGTALIQPSNNEIVASNGTSFACPLLAGMAACLWSTLPNESAMQIRERIICSAHLYASPDDHYGYGIPDALAAYRGTTDIPQIPAEGNTPQKTLRNGQVLIFRGGHYYDLLGRMVR